MFANGGEEGSHAVVVSNGQFANVFHLIDGFSSFDHIFHCIDDEVGVLVDFLNERDVVGRKAGGLLRRESSLDLSQRIL